eukprot:884391-Pleurochrysis_carterae.AAC.3
MNGVLFCSLASTFKHPRQRSGWGIAGLCDNTETKQALVPSSQSHFRALYQAVHFENTYTAPRSCQLKSVHHSGLWLQLALL